MSQLAGHAARGILLVAVVIPSADVFPQTYLHQDLGGVTTHAGNVALSVRLGGRITSSIRIGRMVIHGSNDGLSGISYPIASGTFHTFNQVGTGWTHSFVVPSWDRVNAWRGPRYPLPVPYASEVRRWYPTLP